MIVTCPNCSTRYNLPDDKVPADGVKVKCSNCGHVFKVEPPAVVPPAVTLEEEVEDMLESQSPAADTSAGDAFDETFDEVAAGDDSVLEGDAGSTEDSSEESIEDELSDLFADDEPAEVEDEPKSPAEELADDVTDDVDSLFSDDEPGAADEAQDDLFADDPAENEGDAEEDDADDSLFEDDELFEDEEDDEDEDDDEFEDDLDFDEDEPKRSRKPLGCLIALLVFIVLIGSAVYFQVWRLFGVDMASYFGNVPVVGSMFVEEGAGDAPAEPGESPADKLRQIELKNVRQYYVANEKTGNVFVVEGKAVNLFSTPKEQIKVRVALFDAQGTLLTDQEFLAGNTLSQFQLQVQTQSEIEEGLASEVGILSNNTFIRPGASAPFMAVFFQPPPTVTEFQVKVLDVSDPQ